jgi:accessory gene regulator B
MINKLSIGIASYMKRSEPDDTPSIEVMTYALYIVLHATITVLLILSTSLVLGTFFATGISLFYFMALRFFGGGYHLHSSKLCTVLSVLLICSAPFIQVSQDWIQYINLINILLVLIYAPRNIKGYAKIPEKYFIYMKLIALILVACNFYWLNASLLMVSLFHSILLIPKQEGGEKK